MKLKDFQELRISVFLCPRATYITNFTRMPLLLAACHPITHGAWQYTPNIIEVTFIFFVRLDYIP